VALAGREQAGKLFQGAIDNSTSEFWSAVFDYARGTTGDDTDTRLMIRAGLSAAPYLMRLEEWLAAASMLETAFIAEPSKSTATVILPAIRKLTEHVPAATGLLANVLSVVDPIAAETQIHSFVDACVARGDYGLASAGAGTLMDLYRASGRLADALRMAEQKPSYTQLAGLGPLDQLIDAVKRLQILNAMGRAREVLAEVGTLRDRIQSLPAAAVREERGTSWDVYETLLDVAFGAAMQLEQWDEALELTAANLASKRGRSAPATAIAQVRFNDYGPLLRLGRTSEALAVLLECRQVFEDVQDIQMLGMTLGALADTELARGRGDEAIRMQRAALRFAYLAGDVPAVTAGYHNLGLYLHLHTQQPAAALTIHLAAALIRALTGAFGAEISIRAAADDLCEAGSGAALPADVAALCGQMPDIPGTDLAGLLAALGPDEETLAQVYQQLIDAVGEVASTMTE
jgi:hypothetical protein